MIRITTIKDAISKRVTESVASKALISLGAIGTIYQQFLWLSGVPLGSGVIFFWIGFAAVSVAWSMRLESSVPPQVIRGRVVLFLSFIGVLALLQFLGFPGPNAVAMSALWMWRWMDILMSTSGLYEEYTANLGNRLLP